MLGLRCCVPASSSCSEWGPLFIVVQRRWLQPLLWFSLQGMGPWHTGSVVAAHRLSCSTAHGIFPDQGSNPCPSDWRIPNCWITRKFPCPSCLIKLSCKIRNTLNFCLYWSVNFKNSIIKKKNRIFPLKLSIFFFKYTLTVFSK